MWGENKLKNKYWQETDKPYSWEELFLCMVAYLQIYQFIPTELKEKNLIKISNSDKKKDEVETDKFI